MKEGRRIGVARVELVPEMREVALDEIATRERRLAGTGRCAHPDHRLAARVQPTEQALAAQHLGESGARDLGEEGAVAQRRCGHAPEFSTRGVNHPPRSCDATSAEAVDQRHGEHVVVVHAVET